MLFFDNYRPNINRKEFREEIPCNLSSIYYKNTIFEIFNQKQDEYLIRRPSKTGVILSYLGKAVLSSRRVLLLHRYFM